jgi:hypothetical protein
MHPDFEMVRVQVFSLVVQPFGAIPPLPLSGVQVQPDNVNSTDGVTAAVKAIEWAPATDLGDAFTVNWGRKIVTTGLRAVRLIFPPSTEIQSTYTCPFSRTKTLHVFWR